MSGIQDVWLHANNIIRTARQTIDRQLSPLGLTITEANILLHLHVKDAPIYQEQLAQQLDITKAAISRAVDALEKKGYITRTRPEGDRRYYHIAPTQKARAFTPAIVRVYDALYRQATDGISPGDFDRLVSLLAHIAHNMEGDA